METHNAEVKTIHDKTVLAEVNSSEVEQSRLSTMDKQKKSLFLALVSSNYLLESNNFSSSDFSSEEEQSRDIFLTAFTYISPE
ncbi:hypothetical protein OUZ56_032130 [Daphnia magna]|uniref:Uncharacterized protein n=1 Tax=Daphnia magna TaxID=35525 RepID=A0ABQ9ZW90_9CRUS|nr:hypothetical protein OUZ56_032130 [Daphnia magna]